MKVGLAQINSTVGDLGGNVERCLAAVDEAAASGAEIVVLPEMAVPGCPASDLLLDPTFIDAVEEANLDLIRRLTGAPMTVVGTVARAREATPHHPGLHNLALLISQGSVQARAVKVRLPVHDVFFEPRWFVAGDSGPLITVDGWRVRVLVGGSGLHDASGGRSSSSGADLLVCPVAVPFTPAARRGVLEGVRRAGRAVVWVNACGASDELIFPGRSLAINRTGDLISELPFAEEAVRVVDLDGPIERCRTEVRAQEELFRLLVLGIRDFADKNKLEWAFVGLSGGIDSAVVASLATAALGPARVFGVTVPSRFTDSRSTAAALELAEGLGIEVRTYELEQLHQAADATLSGLMGVGATAENVQARLRMVILMANVNADGGFLLNTSNKTELALGYGTLYGDLAGTLCPIGDLTKIQVYELARWIDRRVFPIPEFVMNRPPTAELAAGQVDPFDYSMVAPAMDDLVSSHRSNSLLRRSEHKRRQAGIVLKVSETAFGSGRMVPVTRR